jgi:hypothetical protein
MCQVSSGELDVLDRDIDLGIDTIECPLEWAVCGAEGRKRDSGSYWAGARRKLMAPYLSRSLLMR